MSGMLEKIARAIALARGWDETASDPDYAERYHRDNGPAAYGDEARAALLSMRDVDPEAEKYATAGGWIDVETGFESVFQDYIDHILGQAV